ncbi:MAG: energy-coupling factor transporter transmembrane protein EcfT [Clostridia bacterium]|jgi:energy-coupling factor transport system permease protein|nr:energy-coupling factor transporter transmembrane protein EcfT [Clostridia bacterium]
MKDVTFGQYYPVQSFLHKMDPRLKLLFLIAYITAVFLAKNFYGIAACAFVLVAAVAFSRVPVTKVLRSIRGILFLVAFTAIINTLFYQGETVYCSWWIIKISKEGLIFSAFLICRLFLLVLCSSLLTYTTTPVALTDGIESLLTPLKWIRFPVHELALIMSIALRFIPILMDETERIKNAQKARGADFESGGLIKRARAIVPILIPLLLSAFRRAEELGDAMDARCYMGSKNRTKYKKLRFGWRDLIGVLLAAALITGVVLTRIYLGALI